MPLWHVSSAPLQIYDGEKFRAVVVHGFWDLWRICCERVIRPGSTLPQQHLPRGASACCRSTDLAAVR